MTAAASSLADLAARLEARGRQAPLVLDGGTLACPELDDLLDAIGVPALVLDHPVTEATADRVSVAGRATLPGIPAMDVQVVFAAADPDALSIALRAVFRHEAPLELTGLPWASVGELSLEAGVTGPSRLVPVVSVVLGGTVQLEGQANPIAVTLRPRIDRPGWLLRAADIPLPGPAAIAGLLGLKDAGTLLPPGLARLEGFSVVELLGRVRSDDWTVDSLGVTVAGPAKAWEFAPGLPGLRDVRVGIGLSREGAAEDDGDLDGDGAADGSPRGSLTRLSASLGATLTLGSLDLPVRIAREADEWRLGISGAHGFPSLGELVALAAGAQAAQTLPEGLRALRMEEASLELTLGPGDPTLRAIAFGARLADHWPIVEGHLALEGVALELHVDRVSGDTSGFLTGAIRLGEVAIPVAARKPAGGAPWTLVLGSDERPRLGGLSSLGGLAGGPAGSPDLANHLPAGLADGAVTLQHLSIEFDPDQHTILAVDVEVGSPGPWSLPELSQFDVRDLAVKLRVASPGDASRREVTGTISGTADLGGPVLSVSASKAPGAANWQLKGTLASGPHLGLDALTRRVTRGQALPAGVPDVALSSVDLAVTPATGAFALSAGSAGPWHVPVGFAGLQVRDLHLEVSRATSGAGLTGTVGGRITLAEAALDVQYAFPGGLELAGHVGSLRLSRLVAALAGPGFLEALPIPAALKGLELRDLDVHVAPGRGRFLAAATVPGFARAAFLLQRGGRGGWGVALALAPAPDWRLSSLAEGLHLLDGLSFEKTLLIVSTVEDASSIGELALVADRLGSSGAVAVGHGLTLVADLSLAGTGADHVLGMAKLRVRAVMGDPAAALVLEAELGGRFALGPTVDLRKVAFRLSAGPARLELGLLGQIDVRVGPDTLTFTGGLAVDAKEARCAVTMAGVWREPFGARGVEVANVALELGISYAGVPTIAVMGHVKIGTFHGDLAVKFDGGDPSQSMLALSFNRLRLADLLTSLCHEVFHDAVPEAIVQTALDICFEDVEIHVVPRATTIGDTPFEEGTRLRARMFFWGLEADAHVEIDYHKGLLVDGQVDPIELGGLFALRGAGQRPKPSLHLEVAEGKVPTIDVNGEVSLLGLTRETRVSLSDKGFHFRTSGKIFGKFSCALEARGGHLDDTTGFWVEASMENDLLAYLREHATQALQEAARGADSALAAAQGEIVKAEGKVASLDREIAARRRVVESERDETRRTNVTAQAALARARRHEVEELGRQIAALAASIRADRARDTQSLADARREVRQKQREVDTLLAEIARMRATIQGERDLATRRMTAARAAVRAAEGNVEAIHKAIRAKERWWNALPQIDVPWKESRARAGVWYGPMIAGMYAAYGTATGALEAAMGVLEGIKQAARLTPIEMDPRVSGLYAAYGVATAALETASALVARLQDVLNLPPVDLDPRLVALDVRRAAAQAALDAVLQALSLLQSGLDALPIDLDPGIASLTAARETALLALRAGEGVLEATRLTVGGTLRVSQYIAHYGLGGLVDVTKASFAGGLDDVHGGEVRLAADVEFMGQPHHVGFRMNLHDPLGGAANLVKELLAA